MNSEKIIVIHSKFNEDIVSNLYMGVEKSLAERKFDTKNIIKVSVPGAFELPYMANQVLKSRNDVKFIITLGCVIKGETAHFEYISGATSNALANLTIQNNVPILFGVITSYTRDQALTRSQVNFNEVNNYNIGYNVTEAAFEIINSVSTLQNN